MAEGTGAGERYLVDPDSLRHSSSRFGRHSKAMTDLRQGLLAQAAETPRYSDHDPQVASFVDRLLRVGDAIKELEQFYGAMADEIVNAAAKAEAADAMVADSASLGEYEGLVITAFGLNQQISNWSEVDGLQALQRLVEKRSNYYKAWGFNPDTVEFSPVQASAYLEGAAAAVARRTGQNPDRVKAILASHMVEAGVVTNGEAWLGQTLAIKVESSGIDNDTFRTIGVIIADDPEVSTAFYNQLGAQESAALPNRILRGDTPPHDDLPPEYQTVKLFATGLAKATNTNNLEFKGHDLTDNAATNLSPGGLAVQPGYLFDTDELFNPSFAVDAASSALIDRNNAPPAYDLNDQPMAFIFEAVVRNGSEAIASMADRLGEDMALDGLASFGLFVQVGMPNHKTGQVLGEVRTLIDKGDDDGIREGELDDIKKQLGTLDGAELAYVFENLTDEQKRRLFDNVHSSGFWSNDWNDRERREFYDILFNMDSRALDGLVPFSSVIRSTVTDLPPPPPPPPAPSDGDGSAAHGSKERDWLEDRSDDARRAMWLEIARNADQIGMDNAARNMRHYLGNSGDPLTVDVDEMLNDLPNFSSDVEDTIQYELKEMIAERIDTNYDGEPVTFQVTTEWFPEYAHKGESQDWFYALGGFSYAVGAEVAVSPGLDGTPVVKVTHQVHVFDRYNWDEGKSVTIGGKTVSDESLGHLHEVGKAQEFDVSGASQSSRYQYVYDEASLPANP